DGSAGGNSLTIRAWCKEFDRGLNLQFFCELAGFEIPDAQLRRLRLRWFRWRIGGFHYYSIRHRKTDSLWSGPVGNPFLPGTAARGEEIDPTGRRAGGRVLRIVEAPKCNRQLVSAPRER